MYCRVGIGEKGGGREYGYMVMGMILIGYIMFG